VTSNLPSPLDSFVGRVAETAQLAKLLGRPGLVTVTGPPGIGKTRLALEVAAGLAGTYPHGAWVADLAPIRDEELVAHTLTKALGAGEVPGRDAVETLVSYLTDRHLLLVIDNCEHLLDACRALAQQIVGAAPDVSLLVTSRERLIVTGERLLVLGPLSVTGSGVELFVDRARAVEPTFSVGPDEATVAEEVCRLVDGIPLAIELVAAQVGTLRLDEIVDRLHDGVAVLTSGRRSQVQRHPSMELALDWSHDLLSEPERAVLRRVSVFTGGWGADAAVAVCGGEPVDGDVLSHLESLVAKSLVVLEGTGPTARYRLLETIRLFSAERLVSASEAEDLAGRHGRWFSALAEAAEEELTGPEQVVCLHRLDADIDNLRAALSRAVTNGHVEDAFRLVGGLTRYWRLRFHLREGRQWLEAVLKLGEQASPTLRCKALWGYGFMTLMMNEEEEARALLQQALQLSRLAGDARVEARCLLLLGNERVYKDSAEAMVLLEQAVTLAEENHDPWCSGLALGLIGRIHEVSGDTAAAHQVLKACISQARESNELQSLRLGLLVLGDLCCESYDFAQARGHLVEALGIAQQLGETYVIAATHRSLGMIEFLRGGGRQGDEQAEAHFAAALELARQIGSSDLVVLGLIDQGQSAHRRGDLSHARQCFTEAIVLGERIGTPDPGALVGLGRVDLATGDLAEAASLFDSAVEQARKEGRIRTLATALFERGRIARAEGDAQQASTLQTEALELALRLNDWVRVAVGLEAMAGLAADAERYEVATRLLAAADALRKAHAVDASPPPAPEQEAIVEAIGLDRFESLWAEGSLLSAEEAVSYALRKPGPSDRPEDAQSSLTNIERDIVALVSEGLTDAEVAARLFISPRTVSTPLSRISARLGLRSRTQLVGLTRETPKRGNK